MRRVFVELTNVHGALTNVTIKYLTWMLVALTEPVLPLQENRLTGLGCGVPENQLMRQDSRSSTVRSRGAQCINNKGRQRKWKEEQESDCGVPHDG
jgi:hypothetical protein